MPPSRAELRSVLESVYADCHRVELIDPDPLLVVREYAASADRELAGLFCASLALGRASAIVSSCRRALAPFGPHPAAALASIDFIQARRLLDGFKYRFFDGADAAALLCAASALARRAGSLELAFAAPPLRSASADAVILDSCGDRPRTFYSSDPVSGPLLSLCDAFVDALRREALSLSSAPLSRNLLAAPRDGSACKRLMLFLRWMVRRDEVDLGCWSSVSPASLVLPLDVHLHRISLHLGLTSRAAADLRAALEVTAALRGIDPEDPIRFDFSLARLGIRSDYSLDSFYRA